MRDILTLIKKSKTILMKSIDNLKNKTYQVNYYNKRKRKSSFRENRQSNKTSSSLENTVLSQRKVIQKTLFNIFFIINIFIYIYELLLL